MKKLLFVAALTTGVFFACQKDSFVSDTASEEALDERGGGGAGRCLRGDTIDVAELPASVGAYVDTAYAGATIDLAVAKPNGYFAVELSTGDILIFNADGAFVRPCDGGGAGPGGHHPDRRCMRGDSIGVADLPAAVTTYINDNYAGSTIVRAAVKSNGFYAVKLNTGEILIFTETGEFLHPCNAQGPGHGGGNHCLRGDTIATADLPAGVSAYVDTAYAGSTITVAVVKPNGYFVVELSTGEYLVFNADGEFIRPCDGDGPGHGNGPGHGPGNGGHGPGNGGHGPGNGGGNGGHGHHGHGG